MTERLPEAEIATIIARRAAALDAAKARAAARKSAALDALVAYLEASAGETVTHERIAELCDIGPNADIRNGIKVRMCRARKMLPHLTITSDRNVGYIIAAQGDTA